MALGDVTDHDGELKSIELLASATATNSPPSGDTAGLSLNQLAGAFGSIPSVLSLSLTSTAGSATMTVAARVWVQLNGPAATKVWVPLGIGGDTTKGMLNGGATIGETAADLIRHVEPIQLPGHFLRIYLEIKAINGTSTAVTGMLHGRRHYPAVL